MRIVFTFVLNAGLNLALGLAIAGLLGPEVYGRYAVGSTVSVVLAMCLFDWLRLSATRFYGDRQRRDAPDIRATLNTTYAGMTGLLVAGTALALSLQLDLGLGPALVAAAALGGLSNGLFDYYAALARARFLDRTYAILVIAKNVLAFGLGVGASLLTHDAAAALAATAIGAIVALWPVHASLRDADRGWRQASGERLAAFARYGFPVIGANILFQSVTLANRSFAAAVFGFAAAGQLSLATDISLRLFLAVGSAIDVFVFQLAVRAEAEQGQAGADQQLRRNAVVVAAVLILLAVGFGSALPAFTAVLVPERYRAVFPALSLTLLPGLVSLCFAQFAVNPLFQMGGRTGPVLVAAVLALAADAVGLATMPRGMGLIGIAAVHAASLVVGSLALMLLGYRDRARRPPASDLFRLALAGLTTGLVMWPARDLAPAWLSLGLATLSGTAAFGLVILLLDVAGVRQALQPRLARWHRPRPATP